MMTKGLLAATIALSVAFVPIGALAQEAELPMPERTEEVRPLMEPGDQPDEQPEQQRMRLAADGDLASDLDNILFLDLSNGQRVAIRLMPDWAPNHVERIKTLTREGFYDGTIFHRVIDGFMAQTGDPTGTGRGGSELPDLEAEFNMFPHVRGTVAMARAQAEDSANSQFFIVFYPRFSLDRTYTNFGRVIAGMAAVDAIERGEPPANPTYIVQASIASDGKPHKLPEPADTAIAGPDSEPDSGPATISFTADELSNSQSD